MSRNNNRPPFPGTAFDVVALAASAGGIEALSRVLGALPADFPAALVVVQHVVSHHKSRLAEILARRTPLRVQQAETGDRLAPGTVFIAPPDRHLLVGPEGTLTLASTAKVRFGRPSGDVLFGSVAVCGKDRAAAVVLSGGGANGAAGVRLVKELGGVVIAQDRATARYFDMPQAAIATGCVDLVLPLPEIAPTLVRLVREGRTALDGDGHPCDRAGDEAGPRPDPPGRPQPAAHGPGRPPLTLVDHVRRRPAEWA
jgi:two-component system chemotaxis response regulator CheB